MPINFKGNTEIMLEAKASVLSYYDKFLNNQGIISYKSIIETGSFLKALDMCEVKYDKKELTNSFSIAEFIDKNLSEEMTLTVDSLYNTYTMSKVSSFISIFYATIEGVDLYRMKLVDSDICEPVPDIYLLDKEDLLDLVTNMAKSGDHPEVLDMLRDVPEGALPSLCDCTKELYEDFKMATDTSYARSVSEALFFIIDSAVGIRKFLNNLLYDEAYYKNKSLNGCRLLDDVRDSFMFDGKDYDTEQFNSAIFDLNGELCYMLPG